MPVESPITRRVPALRCCVFQFFWPSTAASYPPIAPPLCSDPQIPVDLEISFFASLCPPLACLFCIRLKAVRVSPLPSPRSATRHSFCKALVVFSHVFGTQCFSRPPFRAMVSRNLNTAFPLFIRYIPPRQSFCLAPLSPSSILGSSEPGSDCLLPEHRPLLA